MKALIVAFTAGAGFALFSAAFILLYQEEQLSKAPPWPRQPEGHGW